MNHELQHTTSKKAKYNHAYTQSESESACEQYYSQSFLEAYLKNGEKDIFNKLQKLIISSIENEKQILTNNMCNFQLQNAKKCLDFRRKQFNVNQSSRNLYFKQLDPEAIQKYIDDINGIEQLKILLSKQIKAIKSLYDDHAKALYYLRNEQSKALWNFNKKQCEAFREFDIKQREHTFINNFLCDQTNAKKKFLCIQTDNILKLQHEHDKALWELKHEHNKSLSEFNLKLTHMINLEEHKNIINEQIKKLTNAIEESQTIYNKNIQKLESEQMKETHLLHFEQSKSISKYNSQYIKNVESLQIKLLQPDMTKAYLKYMREIVKKIIIKNLAVQNDDKLTQTNFDLSICEISNKISDNDTSSLRNHLLVASSHRARFDPLDSEDNEYNKYAKYNKIVQIVIFLYLTKEFNFKLKLNLISNTKTEFASSKIVYIKKSEYTFDKSCLKYLKIVFPNLNNLKNLKIYNSNYNKWSLSLELFELLLLTNLESFKFKFIPSVIDFKLTEQKLKIKNLNLEVIHQSDNEKNNIFTFLKMCDYNIQKLKLSLFGTNNKYLLDLGEELKKCNQLTYLRLIVEDNVNDTEEQLDFIPVLLKCPNLTKLDLSRCNIEYNAAINIAKILSKNTSLSHLNLSNIWNNKLDDKEKEKIREILSHNQTLELLL